LKDRSVLVAIILLLLITLLALGLRLYRLDAQSLWYDEGFSVYLARMDLPEITARTAADIQPPLYYYLLHGWINLFGDSEKALRGLSVLWGVLAVPVVYAVAWQLFRSRLAGLLAALLLAVSPLNVWYGQETRMYTLLTFLCLLSSYLLLLVVSRTWRFGNRSSQSPDSPLAGSASGVGWDWQVLALWAAYTLTNVAALYTHYFAFFVLAFQAAYVLVLYLMAFFTSFPDADGSEERREKPTLHLLLGGLISGTVTLVAYLPWLPHLLTRYGQDVSYWPGQLKLPEVFVDIILFLVGGESIPERSGILLALAFGLALTCCVLALLLRAARNSHSPMPHAQYPVSFLLLYLLLPTALILALSYNTPKFNARYVMISVPALLLLLAGGLTALWEWRDSPLGNVARGALAALSLLFLLGVSVYANYNAFADSTFARADFRSVARYVRRNIGPDETVILISGHMFPVFDYYAPGIDRHRLPDSPTLDTTQTLDYGISADLLDWLAEKKGVWVVLWQDEVVDPAGYLTTMLGEVGEEQPVDRSFSQVDLRHYRLPPDAHFSGQPVIAHPADFNFGNQLLLLGYTQTGEREVTLFWEALQPLDEDYRVALALRDPADQSWWHWDGRPTAYLFPTDRWRVGQIVPGRYDLTPEPGTPPGDYGLEVVVYTEEDPIGLDVLDEAGAPQSRRAILGGVRLSVPATTTDQVETPHPVQIDLGGGLKLIGWDLDRAEAQPGDRLRLALAWGVESQPGGDYAVRLSIVDAAGQALDAGTFPPTNIWHPTSVWLPGQAWRAQHTFRLPIQAQPGEVRLFVQLLEVAGMALAAPADLATIQVMPTSRVFAPPQPQAPRQANFDNRISLVGADLAPDPATPGGVLQVTLYWQALAEMDIPYTVFVHLLGPDGRVVDGQDSEPAGGARPTTGWVPGEYIADSHDVPIPAELAPGEYVVEVGVYDALAPEMPRLPILGEGNQGEGDRVIFGPVQIR
jgi:mannosyltransferase